MADSEKKVIPNRILIRHSKSDNPPDKNALLANELGYHMKTGLLYIGQETSDPKPVFGFSDDGEGNVSWVGKPD